MTGIDSTPNSSMRDNVLPFRPRYEPPTEAQWAVLEVTNGLRALILAYGLADVQAWVSGKPGAPQGLYNVVDKYGRDQVWNWCLNLASIPREVS